MESSYGVVEANHVNWEETVLKSKSLIVVEFWHPQCSHCRAIEPVYAELAAAYVDRLRFARFNVTESPANRELALKYGIMGTPTFKFFCQGRPVFDVVGALTAEHLRQAIEFAIQKHRECGEKSTPLSLAYIS